MEQSAQPGFEQPRVHNHQLVFAVSRLIVSSVLVSGGADVSISLVVHDVQPWQVQKLLMSAAPIVPTVVCLAQQDLL